MTISRRREAIQLLAAGLLLLVLPATSGAQQLPPVAEKLAKTYGVELFGQVEAIRYTFNAQFPGVDLSRSWIWEPKTDQVTLRREGQIGPAGKGHVQAVATRSVKPANVRDEIEPGFVNDQYWLLLPFHVVWDGGAAVEDVGHAETAARKRFGRQDRA